MRVFFVHNEYGVPSGEEAMIARIVRLLRDRGHEVRCYFEAGMNVASGLTEKLSAFVGGAYSASSQRRVLSELCSFGPDVVQIQNLYPKISPSVLPVIRKQGIPAIMRCANFRLVCPSGTFLSNGEVCERCAGGREYWCVLRNCEGDFFKSVGYALRNVVARTARHYLNNVTLFYAQTDFQRKKLIEGGIPSERIDVIPNMVDTSLECHETKKGDYVGFAGRGSPEKGVATLLGAAACLPTVPFRLAGDFWRMPEVARGMSANVELPGHLTGEALDSFYRESRLLVLPSLWYEGFPGVAIEAMLRGKPVIASRIGGLPEIVEDGVSGLLFEPGDPKDLAEKIAYLWDRPQLCREFGALGREKVLREYSPERYYERLIAVYEKAHTLYGRSFV